MQFISKSKKVWLRTLLLTVGNVINLKQNDIFPIGVGFLSCLLKFKTISQNEILLKKKMLESNPFPASFLAKGRSSWTKLSTFVTQKKKCNDLSQS